VLQDLGAKIENRLKIGRSISSKIPCKHLTVFTHDENRIVKNRYPLLNNYRLKGSRSSASQNPNPYTDYNEILHSWLYVRETNMQPKLLYNSFVRQHLAKSMKYNAIFIYLFFFLGLAYWRHLSAASSRKAGAAAELATTHKVVKYAGLSSQGEFVPIAVEFHCPVNRDALHSWASWAAGVWWRPAMFEHLRFCSNGFPLRCNLILFCCMMVLLVTTSRSIVHMPNNLYIFCSF